MKMKILLTGGPVHANLDAVKIITNKFKGGLMAQLAEDLTRNEVDVTYLSSKGSVQPVTCTEYIHHTGFEDYREKVIDLAPNYDVVILGGAVSNLIPVNPWKGKFPSHNYKPGDVFQINFTIAPRVIDEVKSVMKPGAHLFGFKLLSGVEHEELIDAAYETLMGSKATAVFANDATDLQTIHMVTKERAVNTFNRSSLTEEIITLSEDKYYSTKLIPGDTTTDSTYNELHTFIQLHKDKFKQVGEYIFGTVAVRDHKGMGFLTTARGKNEIEKFVHVFDVKHNINDPTERVITVVGTDKATLNAPLLHYIFSKYSDVHYILHYHGKYDNSVMLSTYAPSGTIRDSLRCIDKKGFYVSGHGYYLMFDKQGNRLTNE